MRSLKQLFDNNRAWAARTTGQDPTFLEKLARIQRPEYLWIGCSDSRVPANQITGLQPGEVFVHRNVSNVVVHTDLNALSVIQYAVDVLKIKHIIVCGHYGCGGVKSALHGERLGLVDNWLRHVGDIRDRHWPTLARLGDPQSQWDRLCELNVIEQVMHVCRTSVVRDAWARGQELTAHGWIYGLKDGLIKDLGVSPEGEPEVERLYRDAVEKLLSNHR
jgi:carbonic anhydrase